MKTHQPKPLNCFYTAIKTGNLKYVKLFLERNPNFDITEKHNRPLRVSARFGHFHVFKYFCEEKNTDPQCENNRCIGLASEGGHIDIVKYCLEHNCDPAADDNYAIRFATGNGHTDVTKLLYDTEKCDITAKDYNAFKIAKFWGHFASGYHSMKPYLSNLKECPDFFTIND